MFNRDPAVNMTFDRLGLWNGQMFEKFKKREEAGQTWITLEECVEILNYEEYGPGGLAHVFGGTWVGDSKELDDALLNLYKEIDPDSEAAKQNRVDPWNTHPWFYAIEFEDEMFAGGHVAALREWGYEAQSIYTDDDKYGWITRCRLPRDFNGEPEGYHPLPDNLPGRN